MRGVAAQALLHCELVPGRQAALPDQTLIGFDTASRRQEEAFLLLFFPISKKKKETPFCKKCPSSPLSSYSPWFCCAACPPPQPFSLFISMTPSFLSFSFRFFYSQIKTHGLLFLLSFSFMFLSLGR